MLDKKRDSRLAGAHMLVIKYAALFEVLSAHLGQCGEELLLGVRHVGIMSPRAIASNVQRHGALVSRMLSLFVLLASTTLAPVSDDVADSIRAATWRDLELNALIGNGNWLASLWYNASEGDPGKLDLHIENLRCRNLDQGYQCGFTLLRDGGEAIAFGEQAPAELDCSAKFERIGEALSVKHLPPRGSGHSRTTMTCKQTKTVTTPKSPQPAMVR